MHWYIYLKCIACRNVCVYVCVKETKKKRPMVRDGDRAEREAAVVRGRRVITIMRMDVFIMSCASHSNPSLPLNLPPSFFPSPAQSSSSVCVLHLADGFLTVKLPAHFYSLSREEFGCVHLSHPVPPPPPGATPPPLRPRPVVALGGVMGCGIWVREREARHDSAGSLTGLLTITPHLPLHSVFSDLPLFSCCFYPPSSERPRREKSNFQGTFFHASLCTSIHLSIPFWVPDHKISSTGHCICRGLGHLSDNNSPKNSPEVVKRCHLSFWPYWNFLLCWIQDEIWKYCFWLKYHAPRITFITQVQMSQSTKT